MGTLEHPNPPDPRSPIHHRAPILCVDRIVEASDDHALCEYDVREGPHLQGGRMWEPGLLEGLAQTAALLQAGAAGATLQGVGMLVGVKRLRIERRPRAGELVRWRVDLIKRLGPFLLAEGRATAGEELLASGELKFYWEARA